MWHLLFGTLCILCRQRLPGPQPKFPLCSFCFDDLPWHPPGELDDPMEYIGRQITPLLYDGPVVAWVLKAKRDGGLVEARVLGALLAQAVADAYPAGLSRPDLVLPVPLSRRRLIQRGHNQAALIARPVSHLLGIRLDCHAVRRTRHTPIQPGLTPVDRRRNVSGAFACRVDLSGRSVAIVDDVVTSGATAQAMAACLIDAGADEVHLWCPTATHGTATL